MASSRGRQVLERIQPRLPELGQLAEQFAKGRTLGDIHGLNPQDLEAIYSVAFNLYNNAKFDEALKVFKFLCLHDHFSQKFWMGMAATQQMLKKYREAATSYGYAYILDSNNPRAPLHAADCFMAYGNLKDAESALNLVLELTEDKPEHDALRQRANILLAAIKTKTPASSGA